MASSMSLLSLAMALVLLPMGVMGNICDDVDCGKGKCVEDPYIPWRWSCKCDAHWKRTPDDDDDDEYYHDYLPCVIPNCTLDYTCQPAPPPVPEKEYPFNSSFFDPCYWIYCGDGTCTRNGTHRRFCTCKAGFYNLLNVSYYPCYSDCTLGSDCQRLGIKVANSKVSSTGTDGGSFASSILPGKSQWMMILLISAVMALWK